jgi:hypothetical protein
MIDLTQFSYTSKKKLLIASSVAALVGFAPTAADDLDDVAVAGANG